MLSWLTPGMYNVLMKSILLAAKNLGRRRLITILSALGIGTAFSAFVMMISLSPSLLYMAGPESKGMIVGLAYGFLLIAGLQAYVASRTNFTKRNKETALLRAVGWTRSKVLFLLMFEGVWLALLGGSIGLILSIQGSYFIPQMSLAPVSITFEINAQDLVRSFVLLIILGAVGALVPAFKTSGISPAEITHE